MANNFNASNDVFSKYDNKLVQAVKEKQEPRLFINGKPYDPNNPTTFRGGGASGGGSATLTNQEQAKLDSLSKQIAENKDSGKGTTDTKLIEYNRLNQKAFQLQAGTYGLNSPATAQSKEIAFVKQQVAEYNKNITAFEKSNPTEKIIRDAKGNVTGVESGAFQKTFTLKGYNDAVTMYNRSLNNQTQTITETPQKSSESSTFNLAKINRFYGIPYFNPLEAVKNLPGASVKLYEGIGKGFKQVTIPTYDYLSAKTGASFEKIEAIGTNQFTGYYKQLGFIFPEKFGAMTSGFVLSTPKEIVYEPEKQLLIAGGGAVVGYGLGAIGYGLEGISATRVGGFIESNFLSKEAIYTLSGSTAKLSSDITFLKIGEAGAKIGAGVLTIDYLTKTGMNIYNEPNDFKRGEILGTSIKDMTLFGGGTIFGKETFGIMKNYARTIGSEYINPESVIAPEYLAGEKYPAIKPGQTAGQLMEEFKIPITEMKEIQANFKGGGFHATPMDFKGVEPVGKGMSELYGLYTSPRLNPTFFGGTEFAPVSFKGQLLSTPNPTAVRIYSPIELAEGVKYSQKGLTPVKSLYEQFGGGFKFKGFEPKEINLGKPKLAKGKQYIPFTKTEKEAIIPMESQFKYKEMISEFSSIDKGVRFPIKQFQLITEEKLIINNIKKNFNINIPEIKEKFNYEKHTGFSKPIYDLKDFTDRYIPKEKYTPIKIIKEDKIFNSKYKVISLEEFHRQLLTYNKPVKSSVVSELSIAGARAYKNYSSSENKLYSSRASYSSSAPSYKSYSSRSSSPSSISSMKSYFSFPYYSSASSISRKGSSSITPYYYYPGGSNPKKPIAPLSFDFTYKKKYKIKKPKNKSQIVLSEGFISKVLGRKPLIIKEKDIGKAIKYYSSPFTLRQAPRIIR